MSISTTGDKQLSLISLLKPFDVSFPSVSGGFSDVELGGWIHVGYTPVEEQIIPIWSTRIWTLKERNTNWLLQRRKTGV